MQSRDQRFGQKKRLPLAFIGSLFIIILMFLLVMIYSMQSHQSVPAIYPKIYFEGEYRIGEGPWKTIEKGKHISSMHGDVTLKGIFHMTAPDGEYIGTAPVGIPIAFYMNHINITVQEEEQPSYSLDVENSINGRDLCGKYCLAYILQTDKEVQMTIHNPHRFGNEHAVDEFLEELSMYAEGAFEKDFMEKGETELYFGILFLIVAFVLLGAALFSTLFRFSGSEKLWFIGLCVLFAGGYFIYGSQGVFFWSLSVVRNTTILGICMMLYMLFVSGMSVTLLKGKLHKIGAISVTILGTICAVIGLLCMHTPILFYDTWLWWVPIQGLNNVLLLICLVLHLKNVSRKQNIYIIGSGLLLLGFEIDVLGTVIGWWKDGFISKQMFSIVFFAAMIIACQVVPKSINAMRKVRKMEEEQQRLRAQLQEKRISIMISQIQPHFIYNTLGTIQYLCRENAEQAAALVQNFSLYLRGNFSELDNTNPIRFRQELEHVRYYTEIEKVRFPDMTVLYDIQTEDFMLPALSVQPLVENAVKHGIMKLESGGTITITAYETDTAYCVQVKDDGVGFDVSTLQDTKKHIGIRNVRERLQTMCGGNLQIESIPGQGTSALIQIPKEGKEI